MRIDRKASPWISWCGGIFLVATAGFAFDWRASHGRPDGGSWPGLAFGGAGFAAMLIAMLLAARKSRIFRSWRMGRTRHWMQAHVWIGMLSYPLILYHAGGFAGRGTLTQVLMWLFTAVFFSGIVGLAFQHVMPIRLTRETPAETIADQILHVQKVLREEAQSIVRIAGQPGSLEADNASAGVATKTVAIAADPFYEKKIVPFLADRYDASSPLASAASSQEAFGNWRSRIDRSLHPATSRLESLVDERRQLAHQRRLHAWLHGWLLIHVPLSYGLIILAAIHSVMALRFMIGG